MTTLFHFPIIGTGSIACVTIVPHAPGRGTVNWSMATRYLPHSPCQIRGGDGRAISNGAVKVCEVAEWNEEKQIQRVVSFLQEEGVVG